MPRVLLIEDDPLVAKPTVRVLEKAGARQVDWAPTPATAHVQCNSASYDFLVSDFDLGPSAPNGVELLGELRTTSHPEAVFVCISASPRQVPGWVAFVSKLDLADGMAALIQGWDASG